MLNRTKDGKLNITEKRANQTNLACIEEENQEVEFGGSWSPKNCRARHKVSSFLANILSLNLLNLRIRITKNVSS